jgi:hypothetical protein
LLDVLFNTEFVGEMLLERDPLSLESTIEELLGRRVAAPV